MSTCMDQLSQILGLAKSKKVTDYKKAIKLLLEFWEDDSEDAFDQITEYSKNPDSNVGSNLYSWNDIYMIVHELFMTEINRISKLSRNFGNLDKERIIKLIYITTEKANFFLKPDDVISSIIQILKIESAEIYAEFYEIYLSILGKYVLQKRSQRILMNHNGWQKLLNNCLPILENVIPRVDYIKLLETIELIVRYGFYLAILLHESKNLLPVIGKILENYESYKIISTDILFKLTFTVCQQIATDSRFIICRFAESMPSSMIEMKGPEEKYKLYLLLIQVHHPNGAILGDDNSYVCNDKKWKPVLNSIYNMILNDIRPAKLSKNFIALACEVFRQRIFTNLASLTQSNTYHGSSYIQPRKKRHISNDQERIIDLVNDRDSERAWPMIQIVTILFKKYPDCLKYDEYIEFLEILIKLMNQACKHFSIMEDLCDLATIFVQNERLYEREDLKNYWDKIWDTVLRYLSMNHNEIVKTGFILVQNLIFYEKISNPNCLMKLYLTESIQWSNDSIKTLKILCENNIIPNEIKDLDINLNLLTNNSIKLQLLQWCLKALNKRLHLSIEECSKMLIGFTLKSWYKFQNDVQDSTFINHHVDLKQNFEDNVNSVTIIDIERCYFTLKLTDLNINQNDKHQDANTLDTKNVNIPHVIEDLDFLINSLKQIVQDEDAVKDLNSFIMKTALIAKVISDLKAMKMIESSFDEFPLVNELKICFSKIFNQISNINWMKPLRYTLEITKTLILLFQIKYDKLINNILLSSINFSNLKHIYDICKIENNEFDPEFKASQCKLNAMIILTLYCCLDTGNEISDLQIKIASTILKLEKYSSFVETDVTSVLIILKIFASIPDNLITKEFVDLLMKFIMELIEKWQKDDKVSCCLLQLLPKLLDKFWHIEDKDNIHNVLCICKLYRDQFADGAFGQATHLSLVQCLNKIIKHKAFFTSDMEVNVLNHDIFITFIKSPYYLVRLETLNYIYSIFSIGEIDYNWKNDFFNKLKDAIYSIFTMNNQLSPEEIQEELFLRSISALQILATVICSKSIFQSPALYALLKIIVDKDIDANIVKKILQLIDKNNSKNVLEENLNYLLTLWCHTNNIDQLFSCFNKANFDDRHVRIIFPVLIREGKIHEAQALCDKVGEKFEKVFQYCCSTIIPWSLTNEATETLEKLQNNVGEFSEIGNFSSIVNENFQQIIVELVQRLHDLDHFYQTFETAINLPISDPPHFKVEIVDECFGKLKKIIFGELQQSVFHVIIIHKPDTVQRILLNLVHKIYTSTISEYKAKAFHQYVYFCKKVVEELKENYCDRVATFFIKDIGCTLLNLMKDKNTTLSHLSLNYFNEFLRKLLPVRSAQVANILDQCVKVLTSMILNTNKASLVKDLLKFLLEEQRQCLIGAVKNLGCLPNFLKLQEDFESQTLEENLQHFLKASDEKNCSIDNLINLKSQLTTKRSELKALYEELEFIQGFAENCAASTLHRLIYRLIRLTESSDEKISLEAAKCLGIIGPADLTTLIFHPQETQTRESIDKIYVLTYNICKILMEFLFNEDIELKLTSSDALYAVLNSNWGACLNNKINYDKPENSKILLEFLYPFRKIHKTSSRKSDFNVDVDEINKVFEQGNLLWSENSNGSYNIWIANITSAIANCFSGTYIKNLSPILKLNVQFCEVTLPRLINLIVDKNEKSITRICRCINRFFNYHFSDDRQEYQTLHTGPQAIQRCAARDAIRCMLNVVNHMRIQTEEKIHLNFNYLPIALAAQFSSAYFSSILYAELWCRSSLKVTRNFDSIPIIDQIYELDNRRGKIIQNILREAYMKIGDSDSIRGCGSSHLHNRRSKIPYYTNFQKLDKLILSHDVELSVANYSTEGMVNALRESSLHFLAKQLLSATPKPKNSMEEICYDSLWRLSDWNQITSLRAPRNTNKTNYFSIYHYEALKCMHENDNDSLENHLKQAYFCVIKDLSNISLESCKAVYPKLSQLQMLREIEELNSAKPEDYEILLGNWEKEKYIWNNNFQYVEPILSQRTVMFKIRDPIKSNPRIINASLNLQLQTAQLAQQQGHLNAAARALETLSKEMDLDEEFENRLLYHEARLAWLRKDEDVARFNLCNLMKKDSISPSLMARALRIYGNWIAEKKSENPQVIIDKYYKKAIDIYISMDTLSDDDLRNGCKACAALAQFAHEQYLTITKYLQSPQFESLQECIEYSNIALSKNVKVTDKDMELAVRHCNKQNANDCQELANIHKDRNTFLTTAVSNYLLSLQNSDDHDFLIFRLISLWLDNMYNEEVNEQLEQYLIQISSYKYIPLVPQLAPHMSNVKDVFTRKISKVLERCAKEHPHHTLPVLLALKNLYNDSTTRDEKMKQEPRVIGAQILIKKLLSTDIMPIIQEMDKLSDALVKFAYYNLKEDSKDRASMSKRLIPKSLSISDIKNFQYSLIPTLTIDVKKNGNYTNIISVKKYESSYSIVGGANVPKKVICIGTDGTERPQLVKGRDDLRQDAVMQQVFTVMNSLLKSNKDSKQKRLHVRTYKVVPFTQRSGVLEWCENTLPLSVILNGDQKGRNCGLHKKYYPEDYTPIDCYVRIGAAKFKTNEEKYNVFMDCCKNFHPAFHHFFTENYLSPETWFERRLAYTRSVATTSIIGYILGLGDRHASNILIDQSTAEIIHIDFGIAFEQGKVLTMPETVPFRLTRDIEVAMGVSGVEGTMRRCCEETMTVLRDQREIIVTLLRVLLYDPLYSWAITPAKAATYQSENSSQSSEASDSDNPIEAIETNKLAERALLRVQDKLQGIEEGVPTSIEGQVERLIQQARDPKNLCRLYNGWQAYL